MRWLGVIVVSVLLLQGASLAAEPGEVITSLLKVPLPQKLELCGEPVPLDREDVAERLEIELMVVLANPVSTALWFKRGFENPRSLVKKHPELYEELLHFYKVAPRGWEKDSN